MPKNKTYWTPIGTGKFIYLVEPDMYKDKTGYGKFGLKLVITPGKATKLVNFLDSLAAKGATMGTPKQKSFPKCGYDSDQDGNVVFNFKAHAGGKTATGREWKRTVPIIDTSNLPVPEEERNLWGGSQLKILFSAQPFFASSEVYGVTIRLEAVKVIEGVYGDGGGLEGSDDFGEDEDSASEAPTDMSNDAAADDEDF